MTPIRKAFLARLQSLVQPVRGIESGRSIIFVLCCAEGGNWIKLVAQLEKRVYLIFNGPYSLTVIGTNRYSVQGELIMVFMLRKRKAQATNVAAHFL